VYLAATRLALFRSDLDWAMVIEVFGFSPRAGHPDLAVSTFASRLHNRKTASDFDNADAYRNYLRIHPHDDSHYFWPIEDGPWIHEELVVDAPGIEVELRGRRIPIPKPKDYVEFGIELEDSDRAHDALHIVPVQVRDGI
jgi:hypothetical protein